LNIVARFESSMTNSAADVNPQKQYLREMGFDVL
jgi:hypothetical protein